MPGLILAPPLMLRETLTRANLPNHMSIWAMKPGVGAAGFAARHLRRNLRSPRPSADLAIGVARKASPATSTTSITRW